MQVFVWEPALATGMPELDAQHRDLIDIFNGLHTTLFEAGIPADRREASLRRAFDRLMSYARQQFAGEEQAMRDAGLDERHQSLHRRQHEQFIINLRELWNARENHHELHGRLMGFLVSWIGLHILGVDPSMVRQLQQRHAGVDARDAYEHDPGVSPQGQRALLNMVGRLYQALADHTRARDEALMAAQAVAQSAQMLQMRLSSQGHFDDELRAADRRYFEDRLAEEAARAFRNEAPLSLLVLDAVPLDPNAQWPGADDGLDAVAVQPALKQLIQGVAVAMKRTTDLVAYLGAGRLAVLLPDTHRDGAQRAADRVLTAVTGRAHVRLGLAGGVPLDREGGQSLMEEALAQLHSPAARVA